jgi:hypothetical protein
VHLTGALSTGSLHYPCAPFWRVLGRFGFTVARKEMPIKRGICGDFGVRKKVDFLVFKTGALDHSATQPK